MDINTLYSVKITGYKEVYLPTDYTYYTGVLLADPVRGKDLFCRKTE